MSTHEFCVIFLFVWGGAKKIACSFLHVSLQVEGSDSIKVYYQRVIYITHQVLSDKEDVQIVIEDTLVPLQT